MLTIPSVRVSRRSNADVQLHNSNFGLAACMYRRPNVETRYELKFFANQDLGVELKRDHMWRTARDCELIMAEAIQLKLGLSEKYKTAL